MMFVFGPLGVVGIGQRIFIGAMFGWLLLAAHGLRTGAFEVASARSGPDRR